MAIDKGTLEAIEKAVRLESGTLQAAIDSTDEEAVTVEIPELVIRTTAEAEEFENNNRSNFHLAGAEILVKNAKKEWGVESEGKGMKNFLTSFKKNILDEANIEPTQKISDLQKDNDLLRTQSEGFQTDLVNLQKEGKRKDEQRGIDDKILTAITGDTIISKQQIATLFKSEHQIGFSDDGNLEISKGGEVLKNDQRSPLGIADVMTGFLPMYQKKVQGGNGGGNDPGNGNTLTGMDAFNAEMEKKGIPSGSEAFQIEMSKRISNGSLTL